ncbi:MAG TPA: hypothetical protein PKD00_00060 [Burkholderiales bacterium]|nr:hypothetical protein [Burkholderiales bacterium]
MNSQERYNKITELLSKFKNGEKLYNQNATFNLIINQMVHGVNEFEIIEQLVLQINTLQQIFEDYINRDTRPFIINTEIILK